MERRRTVDVTAGADSFEELLLPKWLIDGLSDAGFVKPSPVQTTAIPMGRRVFAIWHSWQYSTVAEVYIVADPVSGLQMMVQSHY